jgi:hypothetical protein
MINEDELGRIRSNESRPVSRYCANIHLEGLKKITSNLRLAGCWPGVFDSLPEQRRAFLLVMYTISLPTSQETLRLHDNHKPVNAVYCENHAKYTNALRVQNAEFLHA